MTKQELLTQRGIVFLWCILSGMPLAGIAQQLIKVSANGSAMIYKDVSPNQARILAVNDAKVRALQAAGITERISSYQHLYNSQISADFSEVFTSDILTEIHGAVRSYDIISEKTFCKSENEIVVQIEIAAEVIKYNTVADPSFNFQILGIGGLYKNNEQLVFTVESTKEGYLTIFNISDSEASMMFPSAYEKQREIVARKKHQFPLEKISYILHTDKAVPELNRLIFVFTKKEIPYIKYDNEQITTRENIFNWIYSIPPDQRKIEYYSLTIQN